MRRDSESGTDLVRSLEECLSGQLATHRRQNAKSHRLKRNSIVNVRRVPSKYRTSFPIEDLEIRLDEGTPLHIVFKNLSRGALTPETRRIKPDFVHDPVREIETYRTILSSKALGTAAFYGSVVDANCDRYWLFIEKVSGIELYQVGDLATWEAVARWLAQMHIELNADFASVQQASHLLHYDAGFYERWLRRALQFSSRESRQKLEWLASRYSRVIERLLAMPRSFIHGEFYASNVLVCEVAETLRVCPVDWEMAAVGPGLVDVAALSSGKWNAPERQKIALAYRNAMRMRASVQAVDVFLESVEYCRLHLCIQWLGWAPNWSPPSEHTQDWLGEAVCLAEKLGL